VFHDANYTFRTERAIVDTEKKLAWGDKPVVATGPKGTIESKGFRIIDKGATIIFTGKTKVLLHLDDQDMKDITGEGKGAKTEKAPAATKPAE
jgi:lipopolysaccharide export system protein LptC